jgi:hypothetical protein
MAIAERLRTAQPEGTCSIGVAAWNARETAAELVRRADQALYAAKTGGRNRCHASVERAAEPAERGGGGGRGAGPLAAAEQPGGQDGRSRGWAGRPAPGVSAWAGTRP